MHRTTTPKIIIEYLEEGAERNNLQLKALLI
jgi:hypothetical protein